MSGHHVQALAIAAVMVIACAAVFAFLATAAGGAQMFFAVVQLAGTIAGGVVGNAMTSSAGITRDLTPPPGRATLPTTPQKNGPLDG